MRSLFISLLFLSTSLFSTEIEFWHAFEGFLCEKFTEIVDDFNYQSKDYTIKPVYKGNYTETYNKGMEAFAKGHPPHILQVYEVATQTMMLQEHAFIPVDDLMKKFFKKFDRDVYIDAVRDFYSTHDGKMFSLPWNASTGILFYNKAAFETAGLDPDKPPKTWEEVEEMGKKLVNAGYNGFVTAWPAAYHLEHLSCMHNKPFTTYENGFKGLGARLCFNTPFQTMHLEKLVEWQKNGIFKYQGRFTAEPEESFSKGKSAILLQGANRLPFLKRMSSHPIGVGFLPYWPQIENAPYRLNIGGSSFWALSGFDEDAYRGIAQFFAYLSLPEIQAFWHQQTGYLPITEAAYFLSKKKGFYENNAAAEIAVLEVMNPQSSVFTKGIRLGNYLLVREKIIDYLEKAFNEELTAKEALDEAVREGNVYLEAFEKENVSKSKL